MKMKKVLDVIKNIKKGKIKKLVFCNVTERMLLYTTFEFSEAFCEVEAEYEYMIGYKNISNDVLGKKEALKMVFKGLRASDINSDFYLSYYLEDK